MIKFYVGEAVKLYYYIKLTKTNTNNYSSKYKLTRTCPRSNRPCSNAHARIVQARMVYARNVQARIVQARIVQARISKIECPSTIFRGRGM